MATCLMNRSQLAQASRHGKSDSATAMTPETNSERPVGDSLGNWIVAFENSRR